MAPGQIETDVQRQRVCAHVRRLGETDGVGEGPRGGRGGDFTLEEPAYAGMMNQ